MLVTRYQNKLCKQTNWPGQHWHVTPKTCHKVLKWASCWPTCSTQQKIFEVVLGEASVGTHYSQGNATGMLVHSLALVARNDVRWVCSGDHNSFHDKLPTQFINKTHAPVQRNRRLIWAGGVMADRWAVSDILQAFNQRMKPFNSQTLYHWLPSDYLIRK